MKHKKKGAAGRFLSILLAAVMALSLLPADILSPVVYAEETGYDEAAGGAGAEKSVFLEEDGNAVPAEESGTGEDDTEEPETEAGSTEEPETEARSTEEPESKAGSTEEPENGDGSTEELESGAGSTEGPDDGEEPGEEPAGTEKEDTAECVCRALCTADSVNGDCPVCGAEGAGIAGCKGEPEDTKKEDTEQEDTEEENTEQEDKQDTGLCGHHPGHTQECGYTEGTQDKEGTPCTYACRICPIEELIAALPEEVTGDNAKDVRAQLDEILSLYKELTQEEQDQIDLSRCYELQEELDAVGVPAPLGDGEIPEDAVAKVETSGGTVTYVGKDEFANAFTFGDATITLLDNVMISSTVTISSGTFTLDLNGKTLARTVSQEASLEVGGGTLTIIDGPGGGKVTSTEITGFGLRLNGGTVHLNGGSFTGNEGAGVRCESGTLYVSGNATIGDVNDFSGLNVYHPSGSLTVQLSGGTYNDGIMGAIFISSRDNMTLGDLLEEGYAYFDEDGAPILDSLDKTVLPGPITVKPCNHEGIISYQSNNDGTHTLTCRACGYTETADCTCVLGGTVEGTTAHLTEKCTVCGYSNELGDVKVTIPQLTYGETAGKKDEFKCETAIQFGSYQPVITIDGAELNSDIFERNLAGLSAGEYKDRLKLVVFYPVDAALGGEITEYCFPIPFTIDRAPLTERMVTLTPENAIYTGAAQKPAVTVTQGTNTLTERTDYEISYSRGGTAAADFTNAGTVTATVTGKGNYTGQVTRTFTIGKAPGRPIPDPTGSYTVSGEKYIYTITPIEGAVYRMGDSGGWTTPEETAGNVFEGIKPGTGVAFYAKMPETGNYKEGAAKSITVNFPKLPQAEPALSYTRETDAAGNITLTITEAAGAEYSFDGGQTWTDSNVKDGFDASQTAALAIRLKETDTHNPSAAHIVTVNLAKEDRGAPPDFTLAYEANGETDYTVTIPPTEGCEYSFDGETWSDVNRKTGVKVGETVTGYKRYKETDNYNAGSAASAKAAMPKFRVKTPVISPTGGSYFGSISVTITCGSPDAEIYYTTDGSTPGRSSTRYRGAFTVSAPATVRAVAIKDGLNDSAAAAVSYTKQDGGSDGGNSSDNGDHSHGGNSGGSGDHSGGNDPGVSGSGNGGGGDNGGGNTAPGIPVIPPADNTLNPGQGTGPVKPGIGKPGAGDTGKPDTGNTKRPGTGAAPDSGSTGETRPGQGIPFIKGEDGRIGWDVIRVEEEQAKEGSIINVDMNGSALVPGDIFDSIKGRDITITFDMGNGIVWSVDGKSVTTDKAGDIDLSVKTGTNAVPADIVNNVTGERYSIQISLSYEGEFGFTAVLSLNIGKENAGYRASLYRCKESTGELAFVCADEVSQDGTASLAFTYASDHVIAIDGDEEEESGSVTEPAQPETPDKDDTGNVAESPKTGQAGRLWRVIAAVLLAAAIGTGMVLAVKKKGKDKNSGQ